MDKRGRFEIYGDILGAISEETSRVGEARLTRVQSSSNVPYKRFRGHVELLRGKGLLRVRSGGDHMRMELTDSGRAYLREYERMKKFINSLGLDQPV